MCLSLLAIICIAVLPISSSFVSDFSLVRCLTSSLTRIAKKKAAQQSAQSSRVGTPTTTPRKKKTGATGSGAIGSPLMSGASTPVRRPLGVEKPDQQLLDLAGLNLQVEEPQIVEEETPRVSLAQEKLLEEVTKSLQTGVENGKKGINLVVIGNVPNFMRHSSASVHSAEF
jgi:hypothetical protein